MIIELENRPEFESRVKEFLHIYNSDINPEIYQDEVIINELAQNIGWDKQSPINDNEQKK